MDSHYSSTKVANPLGQTHQSSATGAINGRTMSASGHKATAANHSSPSRQASLLPRRQISGLPPQTPLSSFTNRLPQASSSPIQRVVSSTPNKAQSVSKTEAAVNTPHSKARGEATATANGQGTPLSGHDELRSFGVEGRISYLLALYTIVLGTVLCIYMVYLYSLELIEKT